MDKRKKRGINLLYVFSLAIGLTIVALGLSVTKDAKTRLDLKKSEIQKSENGSAVQEYEPAAGFADNIPRDDVEAAEEVEVAAEVQEEENFAPNLDEVVLKAPVAGEILTGYTGKSLIYSKHYDDWRVHKGIDISANASGQVRAVANGIVAEKYKSESLGIVIKIRHGDFETVYGNLSTDTLVSVGDEVYAGDIISGVGSSAPAEDKTPHIHFELIFNGEDIDPLPLLKY